MTLPEALKVSNFLRRKSSSAHRGSHGNGWVHISTLLNGDFNGDFRLTREDLIADDWEAKEKSVSITLRELAAAWARAYAKIHTLHQSPDAFQIAAELGFFK